MRPAPPLDKSACAIAVLLLGATAQAGAQEIEPELGGRALLDLSVNAPIEGAAGARALRAVPEPGLRSSGDCRDGARGQVWWIGEHDREGARREEALRIAASAGAAARRQTTLAITPQLGEPLAFTDWQQAEAAQREGDERYYHYAGTLAGGAYHRVEVHYGHDAPGSYLVSARSGALAYLHNGGQVGAIAPDGAHVLSFETLNAPHRLRLAALSAEGPRLVLDCEFDAPPEGLRASACGWLDATRVELAWTPKHGSAVPYLLLLRDGRWQFSIGADPAPVGVHCRAY